MNKNGAFKMIVTRVGDDSMLANIVELVEEALSQKPKIQKIVDKVTSYFIPTVLTISASSFLVWMLINQNISNALMHAVSVMVIACPCAFGLATPTAIMVGIGVGSKKGILIRNIQSLQITEKITTIVFDKTGTLTKGKL